jgi:DNA-3-methyladenine glycosylase I
VEELAGALAQAPNFGEAPRRRLDAFEMLVLDGFQSGVSWLTTLRKREAFRRAFADWDVERITA